MPTFDEEWYAVEEYFADVFFTELNKKVDGVSVDLRDEIEKAVIKACDGFFRNLSNMIGDWTNNTPQFAEYYVGEWEDYSASYYKWKKVSERGQYNWFMLSELPRIKRNSKKSRALRRKMVRSKDELKRSPSLRMQLRSLAAPSEYWGEPVVYIDSHTNTAGADGKRRYNAGVRRLGSNKGGQIMKSDADFVTLDIRWLPYLNGVDVLARGATEYVAGRQTFPTSMVDKLMNTETAYRPLLGPYILWYQNTVIRQTLKNITTKYGAQL
jgi:hypothetical protein